MKVNLGCGNLKVDGAIGIDFRQTQATDIVYDLTQYPWPFRDEEFDGAIAKDIIEHMLYVVPFLDECWRIVKPGAELYIRTSYWTSENSYRDPTHLHYFTLESFDFFDPDTEMGIKYGHYSDRRWHITDRRISGQEMEVRMEKLGGIA